MYNLYGLMTKREVKMAGVEVHKRAKKERGQYPAILIEQAWSINDLLYSFLGNVLEGHSGLSRGGKIPPYYMYMASSATG